MATDVEGVRRLKASALVVLAVAFLALGGVLVRWSEIGPAATGGFRAFFAIPILWVTAIVASRVGRSARAATPKSRATIRDHIWIGLSGFFLGGDLVLWHISFQYTSLGEANLLANLAPFVVAPLSVFVLGDRVPIGVVVPAGVACGGLYMLVVGGGGLSGDHFVGNLLAVFTAVFYACFLVSVKYLRLRLDTTYIMIRGSGYTAVTCLAVAMILGEDIVPTTWRAVGILVTLAITSQVLGQSLMAFAIADLRLPLAALLVLLQPVIAAGYGLLFFDEMLSVVQLAGMVVILAAIYWARLILEGSGRLVRSRGAGLREVAR